MKLNYDVTGAERKSLVAAISQELNAPAKYLGMPTAAYEVGGFHIDKTCTVAGEDNRELVADLQGLHNFSAVSEEYDTPRREDWQGENGMQASDVPEPNYPDRLTIEIPLDGFTPKKLDNLAKLVNAKAPLLKAALGADELPIQRTADTLLFPWFSGDIDGDHAQAYSTLVSLLCKTAGLKKRVTAKEKDVDGSPKYAMRCFLLSLGFIGDEYKTARKILLSRLEGNSNWKNGKKTEVADGE